VRVVFHADVRTPETLADTEVIVSGPRFWQLKVSGPLGPLLRELAALPVEDMKVSEAKLEDAVRHLYRGEAQ
jgi:hypothetical protein